MHIDRACCKKVHESSPLVAALSVLHIAGWVSSSSTSKLLSSVRQQVVVDGLCAMIQYVRVPSSIWSSCILHVITS